MATLISRFLFSLSISAVAVNKKMRTKSNLSVSLLALLVFSSSALAADPGFNDLPKAVMWFVGITVVLLLPIVLRRK